MKQLSWSEPILTPEDIHRIYNDHFHNIHAEDGRHTSACIDDDLYQIFYPKSTWVVANITEKCILLILDAFTKVVPYNQEEYERSMQQLISDPKNIFWATNHATFANIPIAIRELHKYSKLPGYKEKMHKLHTILAPSLTTQSQRYFVNTLSHLLKTFTLNSKSQITGLKQEIKKVRSIFKEEVDLRTKQQWNIFMLAPGGTRDLTKRNSYGEIEKIYMEKNYNVWATNKFLLPFIQQGDTLVVEGMNEVAIKRPDKTNPKDHTWTKGNTYVDIELLSSAEAVDTIKNNTLLERIAALTKDAYGRQVGQVVSTAEMTEIKYQMEINPSDIQTFPEQTFDDTLVKEIIRWLFHTLNKII